MCKCEFSHRQWPWIKHIVCFLSKIYWLLASIKNQKRCRVAVNEQKRTFPRTHLFNNLNEVRHLIGAFCLSKKFIHAHSISVNCFENLAGRTIPSIRNKWQSKMNILSWHTETQVSMFSGTMPPTVSALEFCAKRIRNWYFIWSSQGIRYQSPRIMFS